MTRKRHRRQTKRTWQSVRRVWRAVVSAVLGVLYLPVAILRALTSPVGWGVLAVLPALLGITAVVGGAVWLDRTPASSLSDAYRRAAEQAFAAEDFAEAELLYRKLLYLDESRPEARFGMAQIAQQRAEMDRTERLMRQIAVRDTTGYAPAHFWLASQLIERALRQRDRLQPDALVDIKQHLGQVISGEPKHVEARRILGQICLQERRIDDAIQHLSVAAEALPDVRFVLAQLYVLQGNRSLAEFHGKLVKDTYEKRLRSDPNDADAQLGLAAAELFLNRPEAAIDLLTRGLNQSNDERFRAALAHCYVTNFDRTNPRDTARRLELIEQAYHFAPDNWAVITRLNALAYGTAEEAARAQHLLEQAMRDGVAPGALHFVLGTMAAKGGDLHSARSHLEAAYQLHPEWPEIANNYAWLTAHSEQPDLERALQAADLAVEKSPKNAHYRETRGQILTKLGRYQEAIADLELALAALPQLPAIHTALAESYEQLGDPDLAARHRELAANKSTAAKQ